MKGSSDSQGFTVGSYELRSIAYCVYSIRFWQYTICIFLCCISPTFFGYTYKTYGEDKTQHPAVSDSLLTLAASIGAGGVNGLSRVFFGWLMDKYSFRTLFGILTLIAGLNGVAQYWAVYSPAAYFICIMINYMYLGGVFAIYPTAVQNVFGLKQGPQIYVWVLLGSTFTSVINLLLTQFLLEVTPISTIFYLGAACEFLVLFILYFYKEEMDVANLKKHNALVVVFPQSPNITLKDSQ